VRELEEIATRLVIDGAGAPQLTLEMIAHRLEQRRPSEKAAREAPASLIERPVPTKSELEALVHEHQGNVSCIARAAARGVRSTATSIGTGSRSTEARPQPWQRGRSSSGHSMRTWMWLRCDALP
jgi:hypothetical protein